jgi:hypothetical protein
VTSAELACFSSAIVHLQLSASCIKVEGIIDTDWYGE